MQQMTVEYTTLLLLHITAVVVGSCTSPGFTCLEFIPYDSPNETCAGLPNTDNDFPLHADGQCHSIAYIENDNDLLGPYGRASCDTTGVLTVEVYRDAACSNRLYDITTRPTVLGSCTSVTYAADAYDDDTPYADNDIIHGEGHMRLFDTQHQNQKHNVVERWVGGHRGEQRQGVDWYHCRCVLLLV